VVEPSQLRCLGKDWSFPKLGQRKSFTVMDPPPPGIDRMWVNQLLMTLVSATPDRLVMSVWFPCLTPDEIELHQTKIAACFGVDVDRPGWVWQKGNTNLLTTMMEFGHPWAAPFVDNGQAEVWGWHLTEPNAPMPDSEVVQRIAREQIAGLKEGERN
jgi:hypothetical protein